MIIPIIIAVMTFTVIGIDSNWDFDVNGFKPAKKEITTKEYLETHCPSCLEE